MPRIRTQWPWPRTFRRRRHPRQRRFRSRHSHRHSQHNHPPPNRPRRRRLRPNTSLTLWSSVNVTGNLPATGLRAPPYLVDNRRTGTRSSLVNAADAAPITAPVVSGPHPGYPGWKPGDHSHIISASGPRTGDWYVWVVDDAGIRISEIGKWTSTGPGEGCSQLVVDFDSR